jgi:hypothetical protein
MSKKKTRFCKVIVRISEQRSVPASWPSEPDHLPGHLVLGTLLVPVIVLLVPLYLTILDVAVPPRHRG